MDPPQPIGVPMSLPTRNARPYPYPYAPPPNPFARNTYASPNPSPTSPIVPQATPLISAASLPLPRGFPAGSFYPSPANFATPSFDNTRLPTGLPGGPAGPGFASFPHTYAHGREGVPRFMPGSDVAVKDTAGELDPYYVPALPPTIRTEKKGKKSKKPVDPAKQPTFLTKLYDILGQQEYQHIIRWDPDGEVIIIERPDELSDEVLPLVYRQSRFASFSRQLNIYGFMRKVSLRHVEERIVHPDASTWSHGFLRRDSPLEDILAFKRRVQPRRSQSKRRASVSDQLLSPTESEFSEPSDAYHRNLLVDLEEQAYRPRPSTSSSSLLPFQAPPTPLIGQQDTPQYLSAQASPGSSIGEPLSAQLATSPASSQDPRHHHLAPAASSTNVHPNFARGSVLPDLAAPPQTAPVFPNGFANIHVTQGHLRTRSVQGEPPSASLWSPMQYGQTQPVWGSGMPATTPGLQLTPYGFEGWVNCYTNEPLLGPPSSLGMVGERMAAGVAFGGPSSVPTSFAPGQGVHSHVALGEPFRYQVPAENAFSHLDTISHPPATVSPGVYHAGFTSPVPILQRSLSSPRPAPSYPSAIAGSRQVRRQSIPSTPYSPQQRPRALTLAGEARVSPPRGDGAALRSLILGGMSDGYKSSTMGTPELLVPGLPVSIVGAGEDDGLPSAGMEIGEHPFHVLLRKEEMTDGEEV